MSTLDQAQNQAVSPAATAGETPPVIRLQRINPFPGMPVDVETWRDAHEYHRDHARLHHQALHGWGIVRGLDVIPGESVNALLIQPGVAVDRAGNFVVIDQQQVHRINAHTRGMIYLALHYRDAPVERNANAAGPPARVVESYALEERTLPPTGNDVELVRIDFDPQAKPIHQPTNEQQPGRNELDARGRVRLGAAVGALAAAVPNVPGVPAPGVDAALSREIQERVEKLNQRVQSIGAQVEAAATSEHVFGPQLDAVRLRLDEIARQVQALWQRPQVVPSTPDAMPAQAPGASDWQVQELTVRLDTLAQRAGDIGEQVKQFAAEHAEVSRQSQALADQVASLTRLAEAQGPELDRVREQLDRQTPDLERLTTELDRLATSVAPLEQRVLELTERSQIPEATGWDPQTTPAGHEPRLAIGRHAATGWDKHRDGVRFLARELAGTFDVVDLSNPGQVALLYLTGQAALVLDDAEVQGIANVLEAGGVVLAEGCAAGPSGEAGAREFAFSYIELAKRLGRRLARVERESPLFQTRYVFAEPPLGARPARVLEDNGMVYSDADYGCAWQGGLPEQPLSRSIIRDALEFGVNMATYRQPPGQGG